MNQVEQLLDYMKENGSITGMESITELGIMNYKGRICDLRRLGFVIETKFETATNQKGQKKTFARYILKS